TLRNGSTEKKAQRAGEAAAPGELVVLAAVLFEIEQIALEAVALVNQRVAQAADAAQIRARRHAEEAGETPLPALVGSSVEIETTAAKRPPARVALERSPGALHRGAERRAAAGHLRALEEGPQTEQRAHRRPGDHGPL